MTDRIIITIPGTPPATLSPNGRSHWRRKHRDAQDLKSAARWATVNALHGRNALTGPLILHWLVAWEKHRKKMDQDNLIAALKAAQDGIAAALGVDDRCMIVGTVTQDRDADGLGYIKCAIEQGAEANQPSDTEATE
jgi:hypothetical protein